MNDPVAVLMVAVILSLASFFLGVWCERSNKRVKPSALTEPVKPWPKQFTNIGSPDDRILWGVVANAGRLSRVRTVRWSHVMHATGTGSTKSIELCKRFGFDPDEVIGGGTR